MSRLDYSKISVSQARQQSLVRTIDALEVANQMINLFGVTAGMMVFADEATRKDLADRAIEGVELFNDVIDELQSDASEALEYYASVANDDRLREV